MKKEIKPPKLAGWIVKRFTISYNHYPALGDLDEEFYYICEESGLQQASNWYQSQVLKSVPFLINHIFYWSITMFSNYVKIAVRSLYRKKFYSFINIFGLSLAIALCITGYINYQFSQSFDTFHEKYEDIYLVTTLRNIGSEIQEMGMSPTPLIAESKEQIPGIEMFTRYASSRGTMRYQDKVFNEYFCYVDENFFDMFTFPMLKGSKEALKSKDKIVISDEIAAKYFGAEDPVGRQVILNPGGEKEYSFLVAGIIEKPGPNSSIRLSIVLNYERQIDMLGYDLEAWNDWTGAQFILTNNQADHVSIKEQLNAYVPKQNEAVPGFKASGFSLLHLPDLADKSRELTNEPFRSGFHLSQILTPSIIALLVLLLACFNFINTAIAYSSGRLKEIGIRKVIGGMRSQLIKQFLGENLILCIIALFVGMAFARPVVEYYDTLFPDTNFVLSYSDNPEVLIFICGLLVFTALAAAAYPALYVSKFNPVNIFRGKQKLGGTKRLVRVLLTLQFSIAISAILSGVVLYLNGQYIEEFDYGFEKEQVLIVPVEGEDNFNLLKGRIQNHPGIISIGGSENMIRRNWSTRDVDIADKTYRLAALDIGKNYMETFGLEMASGKAIDFDLRAEAEESVLINEAMARQFGSACDVGKYIKYQYPAPGIEYRIAGIVKDFYLDGVWEKISPTVLRYAAPEDYRYMSIRFELSNVLPLAEGIKSDWKELFPHLPYDGFFVTEMLAQSAMITESIKKIFLYVSLIVLLTSGLGLLAIVSLNIAKRTKEIGIRRVLGAGFAHISYIISREFLVVLGISAMLGCLMGYFMVEALLSSIWAYYTDIGLIPIMFSIFTMFALAMLTIGSQVFAVSKNNPTNSLRYE